MVLLAIFNCRLSIPFSSSSNMSTVKNEIYRNETNIRPSNIDRLYWSLVNIHNVLWTPKPCFLRKNHSLVHNSPSNYEMSLPLYSLIKIKDYMQMLVISLACIRCNQSQSPIHFRGSDLDQYSIIIEPIPCLK